MQILGGTGSQVKKSQIVKNTQHPNYEEGFTFILSDTWADCTAEISILENSSGITIIKKLITDILIILRKILQAFYILIK